MAFHIACPITCRRVCYCELGYPRRGAWEEGIEALEVFLKEPWAVRVAGGGREKGRDTVQVAVPRVAPPPPPPVEEVVALGGVGGGGEEAVSELVKRSALQKQAAAASAAAEEYVRRLEAGGPEDIGVAGGELAREDLGCSTVKVMCRICFSGENEGSDKAMKMLPCKLCNKKYHRSCLKTWGEYRDLFHWSSWACPSCRICEICRKAGDPSKLMFCKRCDNAYHCYCQHPPHKNVSHGPYLCPKHTRCHSCRSNVSGSGPSTRWSLAYTCCDACGRLFVKENYCPVCLKVYRDSELTPMVCCDVCQRWVHCACDGISDEKYQQFQADTNLYYKCAACRGDCYQVKDVDDAIRELWRRRDKVDRDQIASLRVAAGLPTQEELFYTSPFSDEEENCQTILKDDNVRSLKFSVKGLNDKSTKTSKESISASPKKYPKKKRNKVEVVSEGEGPNLGFDEAILLEHRDQNMDDRLSYRSEKIRALASKMTRTPGNEKVGSYPYKPESDNLSLVKESVANNTDDTSKLQTESSKLPGLRFKGHAVKNTTKSESLKATKLVIHIGGKNRNTTNSPRSETSSCHRDQDLAASYGAEVHNADHKGTSECRDKERNIIKLGKVSDMHKSSGSNIIESELKMTSRNALTVSQRSTLVAPAVETAAESTLENHVVAPRKRSVGSSTNLQSDHDTSHSPYSESTFSDPKPLLKLKFKNPYFEQRNSRASQGDAEKTSVKGQRSKRKRPSVIKGSVWEDEDNEQQHPGQLIDEVTDANWILQKLAKNAIGKRVEVHESSGDTWHQGVVTNFAEDSSSLSVLLDDGSSRTLELWKQRVRFVSKKQHSNKG